jgi:alpha-1,3-glucan synthase
MDGKRISVAPSLHPNYTASQEENDQYGSFLTKANRQLNRKLTKKLTITYGRQAAKDPFIPGTATPTTATMTEFNDDELLPPVRPFAGGGDHSKRKSFDSINSIMEEHGAESPLNQAIEGFTDENGQVTQEFIAKLSQLNSANSKGDLCIAEYLVAAEKAYFKHVRDDKLALARSQFDGATLRGSTKRPISRAISEWSVKKHALDNDEEEVQTEGSDEPLATAAELNQWQIRLQKVYFGWPVYTILLAFGQVLGATSFQLSLLGGSSSQRTFDLYSKLKFQIHRNNLES